jgi:hypothetical protein
MENTNTVYTLYYQSQTRPDISVLLLIMILLPCPLSQVEDS